MCYRTYISNMPSVKLTSYKFLHANLAFYLWVLKQVLLLCAMSLQSVYHDSPQFPAFFCYSKKLLVLSFKLFDTPPSPCCTIHSHKLVKLVTLLFTHFCYLQYAPRVLNSPGRLLSL